MTRFPALGPQTAAAALLVPHVLVGSALLAAAAYRFIEEPARVWMLDRDPSRRVGSARRDAREARSAQGRGSGGVWAATPPGRLPAPAHLPLAS